MLITRRSPFSGIVRTLDLPVTEAQYLAWECGDMIQDAMPDLTQEEREFIITGITAKEWEEAFGSDDDSYGTHTGDE